MWYMKRWSRWLFITLIENIVMCFWKSIVKNSIVSSKKKLELEQLFLLTKVTWTRVDISWSVDPLHEFERKFESTTKMIELFVLRSSKSCHVKWKCEGRVTFSNFEDSRFVVACAGPRQAVYTGASLVYGVATGHGGAAPPARSSVRHGVARGTHCLRRLAVPTFVRGNARKPYKHVYSLTVL